MQLGLSDLSNKHTECLIKFEFQTNNEISFSICAKYCNSTRVSFREHRKKCCVK